MKIIAVGDIHGRSIWQEIAEKEKDFDKFIFIGDYFDTIENIVIEEEIENFNRIIEFKKKHGEKVVLLFGNHDFHYLKCTGQYYSLYNFKSCMIIEELIDLAIKRRYFQMCFQYESLMFSHAGITKTWIHNNKIPANSDLEETINQLLYENPEVFEFQVLDETDFSGDNEYQSPIWVREESLKKDGIENYIQIVGHSIQPKITISQTVIFIDTLSTSKEYLCIENSTIEVRQL